MKVTRITVDQELGIITLTTEPGGDGDYVLLPLDLPAIATKYVRFPDSTEAEVPEEDNVMPWYSGLSESPAEARGVTEREAKRTGWNEGYDAAIEDMGGTDYGIRANPYSDIKYVRSPELQKMHEQAIVDDTVPPVITPEGDSHADDIYAIRDVNGFVVTSIANTRENYAYHPGEGRWLPNPLPVYASEHGRGYRLSSPHIPHWSYDIQKYELHRVPTLALAAAKRAAKDITNTDIAVIIKEMS